MRILLDEMWPAEISVQLRRRGYDAIAVVERPDLRGQPDSAIFAFAQANGYTIVTENVIDSRPLAADEIAQGHTHHGLIFTTNRSLPRHDSRSIGRLIAALGRLMTAGLELNSVEHWLSE